MDQLDIYPLCDKGGLFVVCPIVQHGKGIRGNHGPGYRRLSAGHSMLKSGRISTHNGLIIHIFSQFRKRVHRPRFFRKNFSAVSAFCRFSYSFTIATLVFFALSPLA